MFKSYGSAPIIHLLQRGSAPSPEAQSLLGPTLAFLTCGYDALELEFLRICLGCGRGVSSSGPLLEILRDAGVALLVGASRLDARVSPCADVPYDGHVALLGAATV